MKSNMAPDFVDTLGVVGWRNGPVAFAEAFLIVTSFGYLEDDIDAYAAAREGHLGANRHEGN